MIITHGKRLTALEVENGKLKKMLAEQTIVVSLLKEMIGKTTEARFEEDNCGLGL